MQSSQHGTKTCNTPMYSVMLSYFPPFCSDSSFYFPSFVFFRFLVLLACCSDPHSGGLPLLILTLNFLYELFDLGVVKQTMTDKPPVGYVLMMITQVCYQSRLSRNSEMVCHVIWTALLSALFKCCPF